MFSESSFFSSVPFALFSAVFTGATWCVIGTIMSDAPKKGVRTDIYQGIAAVIGVLAGVIGTFCCHGWSSAAPKTLLLYFVNDFFSCFMNFFMMQMMSKAMQIGPNGAIWGIIQSAVLAPFAMGILAFGVAVTPMRIGGISALLLGLVFFAMTKNSANTATHSRWRLYTFIAFVITCVQQCVSTLPTYFEQFKEIPSIFRCIGCSTGAVFAFLLYFFIKNHQDKEFYATAKEVVHNPQLWKYLFIGQVTGLPVSYLFFYPAMMILSQNNLGSLSYPLVICACILSFTVVTIIHMKEKVTAPQLLALACCTIGIILFCVQ